MDPLPEGKKHVLTEFCPQILGIRGAPGAHSGPIWESVGSGLGAQEASPTPSARAASGALCWWQLPLSELVPRGPSPLTQARPDSIPPLSQVCACTPYSFFGCLSLSLHNLSATKAPSVHGCSSTPGPQDHPPPLSSHPVTSRCPFGGSSECCWDWAGFCWSRSS